MITIGITTYNRPKKCLSLFKDIVHECDKNNTSIVLVDDGSVLDYSETVAFLNDNGVYCKYLKRENNLGKKGYFINHNLLRTHICKLSPEGVIIIPDDVNLVKGFFGFISKFEKMKEYSAINLLNVSGGRLVTQWVNDSVIEKVIDGVRFITSGYVDMGMYIHGDVYCNKLVPLRADYSTPTGSGVGREFTFMLRKYGSILQVRRSLLIHGDHHSVLNPNERKLNPLISNEELEWCRKT